MAQDTRYRPPTKVGNLNIPYLSLVQRSDPDWNSKRHNEVEYEFSNGRVFRGDPDKRGAYGDD